MVTTFAVVNLLVGLIVNSMQDAHSEEADQKQIPIATRFWPDLRRLRNAWLKIDELYFSNPKVEMGQVTWGECNESF